MATHSSTLAWKIPWATIHGITVRDDWVTSLSLSLFRSLAKDYCFWFSISIWPREWAWTNEIGLEWYKLFLCNLLLNFYSFLLEHLRISDTVICLGWQDWPSSLVPAWLTWWRRAFFPTFSITYFGTFTWERNKLPFFYYSSLRVFFFFFLIKTS